MEGIVLRNLYELGTLSKIRITEMGAAYCYLQIKTQVKSVFRLFIFIQNYICSNFEFN